MRKRKEVEADGSRKDILALEVLLDIRELLKKKKPDVTKKQDRRLKWN